VLDHDLPISMIEKTGTLARYIAIAAPERMDLVSDSDYSVAAQIGDHLPGYIDDLTVCVCVC
jgi:hypothetical protein